VETNAFTLGPWPRSANEKGDFVLSGHQPVYLPGIILFNKIALSDAFMFVGHCQYVKKSWHSRNRICLGNRELWLSIPVKTAGLFDQPINDTYPLDGNWKRKHLGSIRQAYGKARFFDLYFPELEAQLQVHSGSLSDLNISLIRLFLKWLEITTPILDSRSYQIAGTKTAMLISMCEAVGASAYLSNEGSRAYVDEKQMEDAGFKHLWQSFRHPTYSQQGPFMPNLSIIDLLFHAGAESRQVVLECGNILRGEVAFPASA